MRRRFAVLGFAGTIAVGAAALAVLPTKESKADAVETTNTFVVPMNDGYGIGECIGSGSSCGQVVADQWCTAQGFARSVSFGMSDPADVTGSIETVRADTRPISITCGR